MKKPSLRMQIDSRNLLAARDQWRQDMNTHNVSYIQRQMFDVAMHSQLAMIERLDALVELMEHFVVDHVCVKGHKNGPKPDEGGIDGFLKGLSDNHEPKED